MSSEGDDRGELRATWRNAGEKQPLTSVSTRQQHIAATAKKYAGSPLTTLSHHIDLLWLREAYGRVRRDSAPGVDGQTVAEYGENLEANLKSLLARAKNGTYRAPPVKRVHIPKSETETRPIGLPTVEEKVLTRAVTMLLEPVYEQDFLDCSYGFRPGRSPHQALDAVRTAVMGMGGGWVLDVDVRKYFDTIPKQLLREVLNRRVRDGVINRLIGKWLNAGVWEAGKVTYPEAGTPQGSVISPCLSNVYLHEVLDCWFERVIKPQLRGKAELIRFADDCVPRAKDDMMYVVLCVTVKPMRESKAPRDRLTGAGLKSPLAAVVKSHGRERRRKRPDKESGQMSDREMNASEPLMKCRKRRNEVETGGMSLTQDQCGRSLFRAARPPALRWHDPVAWRLYGTWEPSVPMATERTKQKTCEARSREAARRGGSTRSSEEVPDKGMEPRGRAHGGWAVMSTGNGRN